MSSGVWRQEANEQLQVQGLGHVLFKPDDPEGGQLGLRGVRELQDPLVVLGDVNNHGHAIGVVPGPVAQEGEQMGYGLLGEGLLGGVLVELHHNGEQISEHDEHRGPSLAWGGGLTVRIREAGGAG